MATGGCPENTPTGRADPGEVTGRTEIRRISTFFSCASCLTVLCNYPLYR